MVGMNSRSIIQVYTFTMLSVEIRDHSGVEMVTVLRSSKSGQSINTVTGSSVDLKQVRPLATPPLVMAIP